MLMLLLGTVAVVGLLYYYVVKPMRYWKDRGVVQGKPIWIFGDYLLNFIGKRNGTEAYQEVYKQSPNLRYTGFYRFSSPILVVRDPELIKEITIKEFDAFTDHAELIPAEADPLWAKNLFSLTGLRWREMRTHLSPSFTSSKMRAMFTMMTECAENLVQHLLQKKQEVVTVDLRDTFSRFTNDVIATTVFGVKVDSLAQLNNEFYQMGNDVANFSTPWKTFKMLLFWFLPAVRNFMKVQFISDKAGSYFRRIIDDTIKIREENGIVRPDLLHLLVQTRKLGQKQEAKVKGEDNFSKEIPDITNEDITAHALVFFIGGFESVSSSISFSLYELAVNPDVQEKLRREVLATLEECEGKLGNVTYETLTGMKYMEMVVSETMRKWPHFTWLNRICTKSHTIEPVMPGEKQIKIEKGTELAIPMYSIQHDSKYYPDPDRFDPERFSDENKRNILPYTYFPFGIGPRNCIGARFSQVEMKVILFYLLSHFEIVPVDKTQIPLKCLKNTVINLRPVGGFWLGFKQYKE